MSNFNLRLTDGPEPTPPADLPTGLTWIRYQVAAQRAGLNVDACRRLCGEKFFNQGLARLDQREGDKQKQWYVHESADPRFLPVKSVDVANQQFDLRKLTDAQRDTLLHRERIIKEWELHLAAAVTLSLSRDAATDSFINKIGGNPSRRTLYRWIADYKTHGRAGLVDGRGKLAADEAAGGDDDHFRELLKEIYLATRVNGLSKQRVYDIACFEAGRNGWTCPSARTARRWLDEIPQSIVEAAKGKRHLKAFVDKVEPHIDRDYSSIDANDWWCSDDHRFDVIVRDGADKDGKPRHVRPWLHAWQDVRSRKIVGYSIVTTDPNAELYLSTVCDAMENHGVPKIAYVDNGKAFDSKKLQGYTKKQRQEMVRKGEKVQLSEAEIKQIGGALQSLEITTTHAWPFHGQSKPIERFFGTICSRFSKTWETYCGSTTSSKPEGLQDRVNAGRAPELKDFITAFAEWLANDYHAKDHGGDSMDGMTPDQAYAKCLVRKQVIEPAKLEFACRPRFGPVLVRQNGVTYQGLMFGRYDPALIERIGQKVMLVIPRRLDNVIVTDLEGRPICRAKFNVKTPWSLDDDAVRAGIAEKKRLRKAAKQYHEARPRLGLDISDLALRAAADKAQQHRAGQPAGNDPPPILQPVRTPFDGDANGIENLANRPLKLAAGAEVEPNDLQPISFADLMRSRSLEDAHESD